MLIAIASALLATTPAPAVLPAVDVGRFDPARFPAASVRTRDIRHEPLLTHIEDLLRQRRCRIAGQTHRSFDIRVPYVVMLKPDGTPTRFIVADLGCPPLETHVGAVLLDLTRSGEFAPTGQAGARWHQSELRFTVGTPHRP